MKDIFKKRTQILFFSLLILTISTPITCQFSNLFGNTNGISPNTGSSTDNVQNSESSTVSTTLSSVIKEDSADVPVITDHYKNFCIAIINFVNIADQSFDRITQDKAAVCDRIILNSGDNLKNKWLADKMIGYLGETIRSQSTWDYNAGVSNLIGMAGNLNTQFLNQLNNNKQQCWTKQDNCQLSTSLLNLGIVQSTWNSVRNAGQVKVKEHIEAVEASSGSPTSLGRRRLLRSIQHNIGGNRANSNEFNNRLKFDALSQEEKKKLQETLNRFAPDPKTMNDNQKKIYKLKDDVRIVMGNINEVIRKYESFDKETQQKILKGVRINLKHAEARCEKKFGEKNCKKMNEVAYCYKCPKGQDVYWKTTSTCGCKGEVNTKIALSNTNLWIRILGQKNHGNQQNQYGQIEVTQQDKKQAELMTKTMDMSKINDAFFYEVEDYYRDHKA